MVGMVVAVAIVVLASEGVVVLVLVGVAAAGVVVLVGPVAAGVVVVVAAVKDCGPTLAKFMLDHEI
jgi:hypothetical protein